uniref:Uncharacterized protein n=1 Tax=Vespula pensylvanica TaxID=30213 RepID=A0A834P2B0_VESPE|nr:hypothetical protein H0235_007617 [Vespula pensylvanica]
MYVSRRNRDASVENVFYVFENATPQYYSTCGFKDGNGNGNGRIRAAWAKITGAIAASTSSSRANNPQRAVNVLCELKTRTKRSLRRAKIHQPFPQRGPLSDSSNFPRCEAPTFSALQLMCRLIPAYSKCDDPYARSFSSSVITI